MVDPVSLGVVGGFVLSHAMGFCVNIASDHYTKARKPWDRFENHDIPRCVHDAWRRAIERVFDGYLREHKRTLSTPDVMAIKAARKELGSDRIASEMFLWTEGDAPRAMDLSTNPLPAMTDDEALRAAGVELVAMIRAYAQTRTLLSRVPESFYEHLAEHLIRAVSYFFVEIAIKDDGKARAEIMYEIGKDSWELLGQIDEKLDRVSNDARIGADQATRAAELGEANLAQGDRIEVTIDRIEAVLEQLRKERTDEGASAPVDPERQKNLAGALQEVREMVQDGDQEMASAIERGNASDVSARLKKNLERDWDYRDAMIPELDSHLIERALQASALALAVNDLDGAERMSQRIIVLDPQNVVAINRLGSIADQRGRYEDAGSWFARLAERAASGESKSIGYSNWGATLDKQADASEGEDRARLRREAIEKFKRATVADPDLAEAWTNWGNALVKQADASEGEDRARLLREAIAKHKKATVADPDDAKAWFNWGVALGQQADASEGEDRARLLREAIEKYEKATVADPDDAKAWYNWGATLGQQADASEGEDRARLLREVIEKYGKATEADPNHAGAWTNWGVALGEQADASEGEDRARLLREAIEKYERATVADPDLAEAWSSWGVALGRHAVDALDSGDQVSGCRLLREAIDRYERAGNAEMVEMIKGYIAQLGCDG